MTLRRKLAAVDDPLTTGSGAAEPVARSARPAETAALYVRLPLAESDRLARAAFELRAFKREIVAALIAEHVDPHDEDSLAALRRALEAHRQRSA